MTEKKRRHRIPKVKRLSDGSISIDGFIAPAPKMAPPAPARNEPINCSRSAIWAPALTAYIKPKPCYRWVAGEIQEETGRDFRLYFERATNKGGEE